MHGQPPVELEKPNSSSAVFNNIIFILFL